MKTFRINYFRKNNNESDAMLPDALTVFDQAEFDVEDGNETALLRLFSAFVAENEYEVLSISTIDEVPFDGREEYPFQNTFMDRVNTLTASAHSFLSALAIGGVERNDDLIESLVLCGKAILEKQHIDTCFPSYGPNGVPCYRSESCPGKKCPFRKGAQLVRNDVRTNAKWEKSRAERYAERWFINHGFDCYLVKQYINKTVYRVSKDGIEDRFELPRAVENPKEFMQMYESSFAMKQALSKKSSENK